MIPKNVRKEMIRKRAIAKGLFAVAAFVTLSKGEIREEVQYTRMQYRESMNDETRQDEEIGNTSQLSFDEIKQAKDREENYLLTPEERATLRRDRLAYEAARESVAQV